MKGLCLSKCSIASLVDIEGKVNDMDTLSALLAVLNPHQRQFNFAGTDFPKKFLKCRCEK